jgi:translation initiation factor IF-2
VKEQVLAKTTGKTTRIHQLAKELGVDSKDIVAKCIAEEIPDIKDHMSVVSFGLAATIREWFGAAGGVATAVEVAAPVDVEQVRAKARRKPAKKKSSKQGEDEAHGEAPAVEAPTEPMVGTPTRADATDSEATVAPAQSDGYEDAAPAAPERPRSRTRRAVEVEAPVAEAPVAPAPEAPEAPVAAPARRPERAAPKADVVMNVPLRPKVVKPVGPMLEQPTKTKLTGPKVIRVEAPEVLPAPRAKGPRPMDPSSIARGGPRGGRGAGQAVPEGDAESDASRRNKRRAVGPGEGRRSARAGSGPAAGATEPQPFNWRQQDLLEREERLSRSGGFFRSHRRDNLKRAAGPGQRAAAPSKSGGKIVVQEPISIKELSAATGVKAADIVRKLFMAGTPTTINSTLDGAKATEIMLEFGVELDVQAEQTAASAIAETFRERKNADMRLRPPVVTILGHVDHGKTSLLDRIRNTNVAAGEAGGITQATSAFRVPVKAGESQRVVVFLDTPGHEAFTEMRARGAKVTDVVVLVVAADDGVMPQTVESINHAKAAGVPIVVALNKIDKPEATQANIQRILGQLAEHELNPVEWGGNTEVIRTNALTGQGVQELLDILDYQAQLHEWKSDFSGPAEGSVIEGQLEEGRGPVARLLVQQGTLKKGDFVVIGRAFGRVRDIVDDHARRVDSAGPSTPIAISGIDLVPDAGDRFYVVDSLRAAEEAALERRHVERERDLATPRVTLDNIFDRLGQAEKKEVRLIVKADVQGSVETLRKTLGEMKVNEVSVSVLHAGVGGVNESDITLAEASGAIIIGFNVTTSSKARQLAESRGIDIRLYDVIYEIFDDIEKAAKGLLAPEHRLEVLGHAEVRQVFRISRVGMVAGCYVTDGVIERNAQIRVTRGGIVVEKDRRLEQLKRFKDDAREVRAGQECGMKIDGYDDIKEGDVLECYKSVEVAVE